MQAIVLAGGKGTRLRTVVSDVPKPMAPVAGRPFLEYLLMSLKQSGIRDVVLSVGYMHATIINHFGKRFSDLTLRYAIEDAPLGTGGAILNAMQQIDDDTAFVLNGDTFLALDYTAMQNAHLTNRYRITIAAARLNDAARYGGLEIVDGCVASIREKGQSGPGLINAGTYLLDRSIFNDFEPGQVFSFEKEILEPFSSIGVIGSFITNGYFIDIGVPEDYYRAQTELGGVL